MLKAIKYLLYDLLLFLAVFAGNELYQLYLYDFEDFPQTSFYVQNNTSAEQMREDIFSSAERFGIETVYIEKVINGDYSTKITIYAGKEAEQFLKEHYYLDDGECRSFFSGKSEIRFYDYDALSEETMRKNGERYFIIGDIGQAYDYKSSFNDRYGGEIPFDGGRSSIKEALLKHLYIWGVVAFVILLISFYSACKLRKEFAVRCILGEPTGHLIAKNCLADSLEIIVAFALIQRFSYKYSHTVFLLNVQMISVLVIIACNIVIFCLCTRGSMKYVLSNISVASRALKAEYFLKAVLTVMISAAVASSVRILSKNLEMEKQKDFYDGLGQYSYVTIRSQDFNSVYDAEMDVYRRFFTEFDIKYAGIYEIFGDYKDKDFIVGFNHNMSGYLSERFQISYDELTGYDQVLFVPDKINQDKVKCEDIIVQACGFLNTTPDAVKIIVYDKDIYIDYFDNYSGYARKKDLVVAYNGDVENEIVSDRNWSMPVFFQRCMMRVDEDILKKYCAEHNCEYILGNVKEEFYSELEKIERGAMVNFVFIAILIILQLLVSFSVVRLEFEANRMEIILRRIYGNSVLERYLRIVLPILISGAIGITGVVICFCVMGLDHVFVGAALVIAVCIAESVIIISMFSHLERKCVFITLKGGF